MTDGQLRLTPGAQVDGGGPRGSGERRRRRRRGRWQRRRARTVGPRPKQGLTMNFAETFIKRPVATTLLVLTILIFGIMGYIRLPVADLPTVDYPVIQVNANLPGANPDTMASSVATPLEKQFSTISGITSISSRSSQGGTNISVTFDLDRNIDCGRAGRPDGDRAELAQPAARHAVAAVVQQEQSRRHAGAVPDADVGHAAARAGRSLRRERDRPAPVDGHRRRAGQRLRRAEVRGPRRSRSDAAGGAPDRHRRSHRARSTGRTSIARPARSSARRATTSCRPAAS